MVTSKDGIGTYSSFGLFTVANSNTNTQECRITPSYFNQTNGDSIIFDKSTNSFRKLSKNNSQVSTIVKMSNPPSMMSSDQYTTAVYNPDKGEYYVLGFDAVVCCSSQRIYKLALNGTLTPTPAGGYATAESLGVTASSTSKLFVHSNSVYIAYDGRGGDLDLRVYRKSTLLVGQHKRSWAPLTLGFHIQTVLEQQPLS